MEGYHSGFVNPSDSRSEQEETNSNGQVVSPEENTAEKCSICLGSPTNDETSLDGCVHKCIVEWIKLRPICPMCKRIVRKIIHVKRDSDDQEITEEVTIETVRQWALRDRIEINSAQPLIRERTQLVRRIRHLLRIVRLHDNVFSERGRREMSGTIHRRNEYLQLIGRYQILLDNWERPRVQIVSDPAFRMLVYDLRLRRTALVTLGNQRMPRTSISPQFFRDHERYQRSRISEFVRREISAVVPVSRDAFIYI
ncbi:unnamed protein product, partial [Thelazia callipaeda]|uniref:RING-type E3 ubiquitin transferase n=1 Tax=Thelazia callipaeda TaxID=103827 RepID=A0A0N5CR17_THECL